jgi:epoxyqueuosine reductase
MHMTSEGDRLFNKIVSIARDRGITDVSVASADSWNTDPLVSERISKGFRPSDMLSTAESVIVFGIPIQRAILETSPSLMYHQLYDVVNRALDDAAERMALELNIEGYDAIYVSRDGYDGIAGLKDGKYSLFSHRHAAYLAGMGTFGYNNTILSEKYGPRIRYASVITSAILPYSKPLDRDLCIGCKKCTEICPVNAVPDKPYPEGMMDKVRCVGNSERLAKTRTSPCGLCIRVCPVGKDRKSGLPDKEFLENSKGFVVSDKS